MMSKIILTLCVFALAVFGPVNLSQYLRNNTVPAINNIIVGTAITGIIAIIWIF